MQDHETVSIFCTLYSKVVAISDNAELIKFPLQVCDLCLLLLNIKL